MIAVAILINGNPIMARSAVNVGESYSKKGACEYDVDDGSVILHKQADGAVKLAIEMLKTIKETKA